VKAARTAPRIPPLTRKTLRGVWAELIVPWNDRDQVDLRRLAWVKKNTPELMPRPMPRGKTNA